MVTKAQLVAKKRGQQGTLVVVDRSVLPANGVGIPVAAGTYEVKDLMDRKTWNKPDRIGIGPLDRGWAIGISLDKVRLA